MATLASTSPRVAPEERFFLVAATIMALVLVGGFSLQLAMGRSSFGSPIYVHVHALLFFGWITLYVLQNALVATGSRALHRRLGRLAAIWVPAMVVMGTYVTIAMARQGRVPFFFEPLYFLIMDPMAVLTFAGLTVAALVRRKQTEWHRRLMFCGTAMLTGPGFGRLMPMPFLIPWAGWAVFAAVMLFPLSGVIRDLRRSGRVQPAWWLGIGVMLVAQVTIGLVADSRLGLQIYETVTRGSPGAAIDPRAYPPFPTH